MLKRAWILALVVASITALSPVPSETHDEFLKSAINAVTRKKRSLDQASQDYYNELHSFKYHDRPLEDKNDELEFLPNENGQLEMVGDGYQGVNNKLLEKSVIDYLENAQEQERVPSLFRERERSSSRKRGSGNIENANIDGRELTKLFLEKLQDDSPLYSQVEVEENYMDNPIYDRYRSNQGNNKIYENEGPMSWSELFDKGDLLLGETRNPGDENDFVDKDTEQSVVYFLPTERRNVNARFPLGRELENYRALGKRYPVAKRSPKEFQQMKREITDPKVAQDLGALFGTQSTLDNRNYTRPHEHDHNHEQHNHDHEHARITDTSEAPKVTPAPKGQKENATKMSKSKGKAIEVKKKSVDWSQYFGIDRRKKKATFLARPGTQDQDDEWMLQRYYESMAENLKPPERDSENEKDDRKEKVEQIYPRLNNIDLDLEKVKDQTMNRLATAYSMEKMRKALNELRVSVNPHLEVLKAVHAPSNLTQNFRNNENAQRNEKKRTGSSNIDTNEVFEENKNCPELEAIERHCKIADNVAGEGGQMLYLACVMLQICKACVPNEMESVCLIRYAIEANKACNAQNEKGSVEHEYCLSTASNLLEFQPSIANSMQCRLNRDDKILSCLHRYQYWHRYPHYPSHVGYFSLF